MKTHTEYLEALDYLKAQRFVRKAHEFLRGLDFDAIAFMGTSGALVAPMLAAKMKKGLILVRKGGPRSNGSHSASVVEGALDSKRYVIVDDFICSGRTVKSIVSKLEKYMPKKFDLATMSHISKPAPMLVGVYEYARNSGRYLGKLHTPERCFNSAISPLFIPAREELKKALDKDFVKDLPVGPPPAEIHLRPRVGV